MQVIALLGWWTKISRRYQHLKQHMLLYLRQNFDMPLDSELVEDELASL